MRKTVIFTVAALALGGVTAVALSTGAGAQPAGGPPAAGRMRGGHDMMDDGPGGRAMHRMAAEHQGASRPFDPRDFGLIHRPDDRKLTVPDVQKIAEAFLLWNGNRTGKVTAVTEAPDNRVSFALATAEGGVIARFAMDRKNGRVTRTD
jgi:hypothetical protein